MKDVELRRAFERLCRKRGLFVQTACGQYRDLIAQLFEFFKLGIEYGTYNAEPVNGWEGWNE